jgi:glycerophosphoryl diester phosphodiesterase
MGRQVRGEARAMPAIAVQAHRGSPDAAAGIRENTLDAFRRARQLGASGVELDVRMTRDGALAVHHDPIIDGAGPVNELAADDLPEYVPLLAAALDACDGLIVNIEIKNLPGEPGFDPGEHVTREVADLVVALRRTEEVVISSFWPGTLEAVHDAHPDIPTGLLLAGWCDPADAVIAAFSRDCTALHPFVTLVSPALVDQAHRAGLTVAVWTVNERTQLEVVVRAGADTVITDDVTFAREVIGLG